MAIDPRVAPLLRLEIFQGLRPLQLTEVARRAERMVFREGQVIVRAGTPGDGAFVIVSGDTLSLARCDGQVQRRPIEPGSLIGELAMLIDHEYAVTVVAKGPVKALKITREAMLDQMRDDPRLAEHLSARITSRLTRLAEELRTIDGVLAQAASLRLA
jgi:CRP-like cAMP-binding protein